MLYADDTGLASGSVAADDMHEKVWSSTTLRFS